MNIDLGQPGSSTGPGVRLERRRQPAWKHTQRLNKEIKRRTNVVGIFPADVSALRLIGAVLGDQHDEWIIARRYLSEGSMAALNNTRQTAPVQPRDLTPAT